MSILNQALDNIRGLVGQKIGNGQCYALVSHYERLITSNSTVGLGAGIGHVSGAVGDTISAANIGSAYNWTANGWSVVVPKSATDIRVGGIINIKAYQGAPFHTGVYGHTAIITAVNGHNVTFHEQNTYNREWVVEQVYALNQTFLNAISSIVYPPNTSTASPQSGKIKDESGTMTVTVNKLNVRDTPSLKGRVVASYSQGEQLRYDSVYVADGYIWVSYIGSTSGQRRYVAAGEANGLLNVKPYGNFK